MAKPNRHRKKPKAGRVGESPRAVVGLRIIGGKHRGRRLRYSGDPRTRPMKDRLREVVFNLLGPAIQGKHALDLFAGTGALAFEAISRGAACATLIEQHHPTADVIRQNAAALDIESQVEVVVGNVFVWFQRRPMLPAAPWAVFCSPPYDFYVDRSQEMVELIAGLMLAAPAESLFVVEADARFSFQTLPEPPAWDVRLYPPAVVGIFRKE